MRPGTLVQIGVSAAVLAGCSGSPSPSSDPSGSTPIRGTERLGWDQQAGTVVELDTYLYAIYVDGVRSQLVDILCARVPAPAGFACSGRLPSMAPGVHTLQLASFVFDGKANIIESAKSAPLQVTVSPGVAAPAGDANTAAPEPPTQAGKDGILTKVPVVEGLSEIADMGVDPEGRLLIGERAGVVRLVDPARPGVSTALVLEDTLATGSTGVLLGLALDPAFERTRVMYVLRTAPRRDGLSYQIVRYRGVAGIFGERAVLLETGRVDPARPSGTIRLGSDGKLYAAVFEAPRRRDSGELRAVILRLNPDGTTPSDQLSSSPVYAAGEREVRGLAWHPESHALWLAQDGGEASARLLAVPRDRRQARAGLGEHDHPLTGTTGVAALRFYNAALIPPLQGALLVAGESGLHAAHFDRQDASRIASVDRVLDMPLRAIAVAKDGALFVATSDAVFRADPF